MPTVSEYIASIKNDLRKDIPSDEILQKHLIERQSYYFAEHHQDSHDEYTFRSCIAKKLNININDVVIVGSAKLGFSVKTSDFILFDKGINKKTGKPKKSDIDIAIINKELFDHIGYDI